MQHGYILNTFYRQTIIVISAHRRILVGKQRLIEVVILMRLRVLYPFKAVNEGINLSEDSGYIRDSHLNSYMSVNKNTDK